MILTILGALGGIVAFIGAVWMVLRAAVKQSEAVDANTKAIERLTLTIDKLDDRVNNHDNRLSVLEAIRGRTR